MNDPKKLIELCKGHKIYIQTHNFPDPDAIASAFGLQKLLNHFDIEAVICHEGSIDKLSSIKMLSHCGIEMNPYESIKDSLSEDDYVVLVDCQKNTGNTTDITGDEIAAIDHHPTVVEVEYRYSDLRIVGSCSSIITEYYKLLGIEPERKVATALLYGLRMDTLGFSRGVKAYDIEMYRFLYDYADEDMLRSLESNNMEFSDLTAYDIAINNIKVYGKVGFSYMDIPCSDALIAILSDFVLSLIEVEVAILYARRPDGYKFSVRSERNDVDAGRLTHKVLDSIGNGGGHATMAGGFAYKDKILAKGDDVYTTVQELFMNVIKEDYPGALE